MEATVFLKLQNYKNNKTLENYEIYENLTIIMFLTALNYSS